MQNMRKESCHSPSRPVEARKKHQPSWDHLKDVADEIHYRSDIEIGMIIGRNVPTAFQPLKVIYGEADKPWAEKYKSGWTIIGPVCLDNTRSRKG